MLDDMLRKAGMIWAFSVQAARNTAPREVADEVRMQEKRAAQKNVREETALKAKIAKDKQQKDVVWQVGSKPLSPAVVLWLHRTAV